MSVIVLVVAAGALVLLLAAAGAPGWAWIAAAAALAAGAAAPAWVWVALAVVALPTVLRPVRRATLTRPVAALLRRLDVLPRISDTEREALEAGTVWVDGEIFSGRPDWRRVLGEEIRDLSDAERAFLEGPCDELCRLVSDWETWQRQDLSAEAWAFARREGFFGMVVPKEHGGLGFSARAHAAVVTKLASRSTPLAVTVMVPNSLGPAELIAHHGTPEQARHWLPRLASGEEVPCFALTEPLAGSDAGAMSARGVAFRRDDGEICVRLSWNKRYITLAPVATVLGLAFKLEDPDDLLGQGPRPGITVALVPADAPGVEAGRRHDPLGVPFLNGPTEGHEVVVPVSAIVGGPAAAGQGWRMLMETLAAGRGISLPSMSVGGAKLVTRTVGAYSAVRRQFGVPIGRFEGVAEVLARMAGLTWMVECAQHFACGAVDRGERPSVVTAMAKLMTTELGRRVIEDGMDVVGGAGIARGPRNLVGHLHVGQPIGITVEGANILTRSLIVFGQGAIRCHPHVREELESLAASDLRRFDRAFWSHVSFVLRNASRSFLLSLTRGGLATSPLRGPLAPHVRRLTWACSAFALLTDLAMGTLGGRLKRHEMLTGRLADVLSWTWLGMAVLRRHEAEGKPREMLPVVRWCLERSLGEIQQAFQGALRNVPVPVLGALLRGPVAAWLRLMPFGHGPSDELSSEVAALVRTPGPVRDRLVAGTYLSTDDADPAARLEETFALVTEAEPLLARARRAAAGAGLAERPLAEQVSAAVDAGALTEPEAELACRAAQAAEDAVQVDAFPAEAFRAALAGLGARTGDS